MAINFIGPLLMLTGIAAIVGIVFGLVKKNQKVARTSLIAFAFVTLLYVLEIFFME